MRRITLSALVILAVVLAGLGVQQLATISKAQPAPPPAMRQGWWIKVRTDRTEATTIDFQIGTKKQDRESWRTWRSADPTEFDVPAKYLQVAHLYIQATANPEGKKAWLCLMYRDHGVQHIDTQNSDEQDKNQTDSDGDCN